jgi:hypothetical protein
MIGAVRREPKYGEHPLATKKRELHAELALCQGLMAIVILWNGVVDGIRNADAIDFGAGLVGVGLFAFGAITHWRWSR